MSWYAKYMNIPFKDKGRDEQGADCWGLVRLIYKNELGIELDDYSDSYFDTNDREVLAKIVSSEKNQNWITPESPKEFDVVILNMRGIPIHVGIITKQNHMIHCAKGINTVHEHYGTSKWKHKVMGFARWN